MQTMDETPQPGNPHTPVEDTSEPSKPRFKRMLTTLELTLQHQGVECTFAVCYILLNAIIFFVGASPSWRRLADDTFLMRFMTALARGSGAMLNLNSALIILVASRSFMTYLRRTSLNVIVPFDKAMPPFHEFIGNCLTIITLFHGGPHIVRYSMAHLWSPGFLGRTSVFITGSILTFVLFAMRATSFGYVRFHTFETFHVVHHLGFVLYFALLILHGSHKGVLKSWMYVIIPLCIYIVDRLYRLMQEQGSRLLISRESAIAKDAGIVCLRIPRIFTYLAGQYCDIKVPLVSNYQWHPFTIASSPHESEMLFFIKVTGDWTRKLHALCKQRENDNEDMYVHIRGPYGAPAQHVGQFEHVVLISGGVGATPFCSISKFAHHYIVNFTSRGAAASASVSAAFSRNQSLHGTPSLGTGTPTPRASSGLASASHRSQNTSRGMSRNASASISLNPSRNVSRNVSRGASRPLSRSGSGRLERFNSSRRSDPLRFSQRSSSYNAERFHAGRPLSLQKLRTTSGCIDRLHSTNPMDRPPSKQTGDAVGVVPAEKRKNEPDSTQSANTVPVSVPDFIGPVIPEGMQEYRGTEGESKPAPFEIAIDVEEDNEFTRPEDYDEELGNPELPIPDRWAIPPDSPSTSGNRHSTFELVREYDSSQGLFDEDEEQVEEEVAANVSRNALIQGGMDLEAEEEGVEIEDRILREATPSNAYNMLGMSFDPQAILRHLPFDGKKLRSSLMQSSFNLMEDGMNAPLWQDRLLFYLHTVTMNWILLWLMFIRFTLVLIGLAVNQFTFSQVGLGIFTSAGLNIADLVLAVLMTTPVFVVIITEMFMHGPRAFLSDHIANSFDMFVLVPLLTLCIVMHTLNLIGVGTEVEHMSKLLVCVVWPVLSLYMIWRIGRTIGSRVMLAPSGVSSHAHTRSLDYIWVSKTSSEDAWLIDELLPLSESNIVRLHRFITRHGPRMEPWMLEYEKVPLKTTYSRPDWDDIFGNLIERSKSGSVIGVFFCGPGSMARMIQQAALVAMARSMDNAAKRGYRSTRIGLASTRGDINAASSDANVISNRGVGSTRSLDGARGASGRVASVRTLQGQSQEVLSNVAYGCNVKIVVRVEKFS